MLISNWKEGWKFFSNWCFALIAWISVNGLPPEIMAIIPEDNVGHVLAVLSALGIVSRLIRQVSLEETSKLE